PRTRCAYSWSIVSSLAIPTAAARSFESCNAGIRSFSSLAAEPCATRNPASPADTISPSRIAVIFSSLRRPVSTALPLMLYPVICQVEDAIFDCHHRIRRVGMREARDFLHHGAIAYDWIGRGGCIGGRGRDINVQRRSNQVNGRDVCTAHQQKKAA